MNSWDFYRFYFYCFVSKETELISFSLIQSCCFLHVFQL